MNKDTNPDDLEKLFDFLHEAGKLKSAFRFSEVKKMSRKESSADHSWRLALMTFIVADELNIDVNKEHVLRLAVVHDIAEAVTGDIDYILVAEGKVSKEEKQKREKEAIIKLKELLPKKTGEQIHSLWNEYEDSLTKEAKFVKALDKLETLTHLIESGYQSYDKPDIIANYADKAVKDFPELTNMLKIIKRKLKAEFSKGNIPWKEEYERGCS